MIEIYIDESGTFVPTAEGIASVCAVGALVIPSVNRARLFAKFERLRQSFPKNSKGEVKGSKLNELQIDSVIDLLKKNDCIFEASCIDMRRENADEIRRHRDMQAVKITEHLTDEFRPELAAQIWDLRQRLEGAPPQLYAQSTIASYTVSQMLCLLPTYFAQRWPKDLNSFRWIIDAKGERGPTGHEDWWEHTICPLLQSRSKEDPLITVEGVDYSVFDDKYLRETPDYLKGFGFEDEKGIDIGTLLRENFRFSSNIEMGLELVDIATNALRRALNGNLKETGFRRIPQLMIHRKGGPLVFKTFGRETKVPRSSPYRNLLSGLFAIGGRSMLTAQTRD
jgi:hypothetical protein